MIYTKHAYLKDRAEWIGLVVERRFFFFERVLTVGVMDTESGIKLWLAQVVRTRAWETKTEPADKYTQIKLG